MCINIDLTTKVISPAGEIAVYGECEINASYCHAVIKTKVDNRVLGSVRFSLQEEAKSVFNESLIVPKYLYIDNMTNTSDCKYVGSAMHELVFRLSIKWGAQGRIELTAVRDTHYFHYQNGFTLPDANVNPAYYFRLARELILSGRHRITTDLGVAKLHLAPAAIIKKLHQFNLLDAMQFEYSPDNQLIDEHKLVAEAKLNSLTAKIIICFQGAFQKKKLKEKTTRFMRFSERHERMLEENKFYPFCARTNVILQTGCGYIMDILPIDTEEKQQELEVIVAAVIILSMAIQDKEFGPQVRYGEKLLYPQLTLEKLLQSHSENAIPEQHFKQIGIAALLDKTIPFDGIVRNDLFPDLELAPEFKILFEKYQFASLPSTTVPSSSASDTKVNKRTSYGSIPFWQTKQQLIQHVDEFQNNAGINLL